MITFHILIVKETRAGEKRVALLPADAQILLNEGHTLYLESGAGQNLGISDEVYQKKGVIIRPAFGQNPQLFQNIQVLLRVKRPDRLREVEEWKYFPVGLYMAGALDPHEKNSAHTLEYQEAKVRPYSLDQIPLPPGHPMNLLAGMSKITGRLAMQDAWQRCQISPVHSIVLIGYGTLGKAALHTARTLSNTAKIYVTATREEQIQSIKAYQARPILIPKEMDGFMQKELLKPYVSSASIILTSARQSGKIAPILIDKPMLQTMKNGAVVLDLALSEGGNVEGSQHDQTITLANGAVVANISAYPKAEPGEASEVWSRASRVFVQTLHKNPRDPILLQGLIGTFY